jgi:hypothetical protein
MKRIYIAGLYSSTDNLLESLDCIRTGIRAGVEMILKGHAPFVPWLDYQFHFFLKDDEQLTVEDYYAYSMAWLEVSDAALFLPGYEKSKGAKAEWQVAMRLDIPIYYSIDEVPESYEESE